MDKTNTFSYYALDVGRYLPSFFDNSKTFKPYKENKTKLIWNIFVEENGIIVVRNIFEYNWVFLKNGLLYAKKHYSKDFKSFANHIRNWLSHEYWARCEYETVITEWPPRSLNQKDLDELQEKINNEKKEYKLKGYTYEPTVYPNISGQKIDVYTQVMMNWDRFINYVFSNQKLITKKKLGL